MRRPLRHALLAAALALCAAAGPALADRACQAAAVPCCTTLPRSSAVRPAAPAFGVHVWPSDLAQSPALVEHLASLRPSDLRFGLGPTWRRQPALRDGMTDDDLDAAVAAGFASMAPSRPVAGLLAEVKRRTGARLHLVIWEPPPLPGEPGPKPAAGRRMPSRDTALAARFAVALLKSVAGQGVALDGVELSNEPDGNWGIQIAPADYLAFVLGVRAEAARRGVALPRIYGPGTSTVAALRTFFADPAVARGILETVDVLSVHTWDDPVRDDAFREIDALFADLARLGHRPELAVTEYGIMRPVAADRSDRMNVKKRVPGTIAGTPFFASLNARDLLRLYAKGVGTVIYWEFKDPVWGKASFGLLDQDGAEKPLYGSLGTIANALRRDGAATIEGTADPRIAVMHGATGSSLWIANPDSAPMNIDLADARQAIGPAPGTTACRSRDGSAGIVVPAASLASMPVVRP